jgi:hypothetical protein
MNAKDLAAALVLLLVVLTVGAGAPTASADPGCPQTKAVFYTNDTTNLATRLGANKSDCADYFVSISPVVASGEPRDGLALTTVHNQGLHALAELRPKQWTDYAAIHGWYATGVKLHDDMIATGYTPATGDTWAINEVGTPSDSAFATDVFNDVDGARQNFRDFVHGLYDGSGNPGDPTMQGLVFAANPEQLAPNVADYAQKLAAWYADAPFWQDMHTYVSTWAQETYADARAWGVVGSPLAERTAYLNDYFLHGLRVAEQGNDATAGARKFLDDAYVPLANATYPSDGPNPITDIGFGYTNIGLPGMLRFISAQTYAQRSSFDTRLGFVISPPTSALAADTRAVENRVASAIHDSQTDPIGACTATGESCDFDLPGAAYTDSWRALANTQEGTGVAVQLDAGVSVTFDGVSARGSTWFSSSSTAETPTGWAMAGPTYDIATTAVTTGRVQVCLGAGTGHVFRRTDTGWHELLTTSPGCGATDALGRFALFVDPTPPVIASTVSGPQGTNGWYVGDVTVSWEVSDPQTAISAETGCDAVPVDQDTVGTTYSCTATSEGGTNTAQVTVKRDATPPDVTCGTTPSTWHATDVSIPCGASDGGSGLADPANGSFSLTTSVELGTETANASTNSHSVCDNAGNCVTAGPIDGIMVDEKGPALDCGAAPTFVLNETGATITAAAADGGSGVPSPAVSAAADTSIAGSHSVNLVAADNVGNSTTVSCPYSIGYALSGFERPIANTPTVNTGKAGRTYPVKWQLQDANGGYISTLNAVAQVVVQPTPCDDFATDPDSTMTVTAAGATSLRYDSGANQYLYNWATPPTTGCYTLFVELDSGQTLHAYIQLS